MNTLGDTDEGRAKPSVWPVYVLAVVVLIAGLASLTMASTMYSLMSIAEEPGESPPAVFFPGLMLAEAAFGLFGVVAAIGMLRLRGWGWWCGSIFAGVWMVGGLFIQLGSMLSAFSRGTVPTPVTGTIVFEVHSIVVAFVVLGAVTTRRRLFFPPKPEGEE